MDKGKDKEMVIWVRVEWLGTYIDIGVVAAEELQIITTHRAGRTAPSCCCCWWRCAGGRGALLAVSRFVD